MIGCVKNIEEKSMDGIIFIAKGPFFTEFVQMILRLSYFGIPGKVVGMLEGNRAHQVNQTSR